MWSSDELILGSRFSVNTGIHHENWWLIETVLALHYHNDLIQVGDDRV